MPETRMWRPPVLRTDPERHRHATWLELFFDLVFAVAVAQLAVRLGQDPSLLGVAQFVFLYVPIWWAWLGATLYADRFDTDDLGHRTLAFVQMLAIAGAAASIGGVFEGRTTAFALSYIVVRAVLVGLFIRLYYHVEAARPLAVRLASLHGFTTGMWVVSIFIPQPAQFVIWGAALVIDIGGTWVRSTRRRYAPLPLSVSHMPERFGLFTIIVLGESVLGVVGGLVLSAGAVPSTVVAILGFIMAFSIWWIYFEGTTGSVFRRLGGIRPVVWVFTHLPLMMAITALGVGVEHTILHDPAIPLGAERWLLAGGATVTLLAVSLITLAQAETRGASMLWRWPVVALPALVGAFLGFLPPVAFVGVLTGIMVSQATLDVLTAERVVRPRREGVL